MSTNHLLLDLNRFLLVQSDVKYDHHFDFATPLDRVNIKAKHRTFTGEIDITAS